MHSVPEDLILNFDQTPLPYVFSASHTLHETGANSVPVVEKGKKKQISQWNFRGYNIRSFSTDAANLRG